MMEDLEKNNEAINANENNSVEPTLAEEAKPFAAPDPVEQPEAETADGKDAKQGRKCCLKYNPVSLVVDLVLLLAIVLLFVMNRDGGKSQNASVTPVGEVVGAPGNGDIFYVNIDSVYECAYVKGKTDVLQAEVDKQDAAFSARQSKLEADYNQFQQNYQSGSLTEQQAKFAMEKIQTESDKIQADYQKVMNDLMQKQDDQRKALLQTIRETVSKINSGSKDAPNASFVVTYSHDNASLLLVDPTRDMTKAVIAELDKLQDK